ncbi:hypothetical protein SSAG_06431 [Streptomyces sp. Mg1]|nr:hypothetical protein SSAG_06431 [Streptomyces sp. Mg1]
MRAIARTDWRVAGASTGRVPLPLWMSGMAPARAPWRVRAFVRGDPGMRWSFALFKTVTEGADG